MRNQFSKGGLVIIGSGVALIVAQLAYWFIAL